MFSGGASDPGYNYVNHVTLAQHSLLGDKRDENLARSDGLVTNDGLLYIYWIIEASINWSLRAICARAGGNSKIFSYNTLIIKDKFV